MVRKQLYRLVGLTLAGLLFGPAGQAGPWDAHPSPWMAPGDSALRSDVQLLADAGIINAPITTWPLAWGDIAASLEGSTADLSVDEMAALARLKRRAAESMLTGKIALNSYASYTEHPRQINTFEDSPDNDSEIGVGLSWTGEWLAVSLQGQWVDDPIDGDDWRPDGSYVGLALGNWMLSGSWSERWWGPGWQGSLILGNNARPIPAFAIERNSTTAFETKWLSWIGPWDLTMTYGFLEEERAVPDAQMLGIRFNAKPFPSLEVGLSHTALLCGDGQDCDAGTFFDAIFFSGSDNDFDHMAGFDLRWASSVFDFPFALYMQMIGEDGEYLPSDWLGLFGGETTGHWDALGNYRFYLEWADTECDFRFYRSIRNDTGPGTPGCAYWNNLYENGQHFEGASFAHSFDGDASVFTLGGMLTDHKDHSWLTTFAIGNLNRRNQRNQNMNTVAENKTRYREFEVSNRRDFWVGDLYAGVGYEYRKDTRTRHTDEDIRVFLQWQFTY